MNESIMFYHWHGTAAEWDRLARRSPIGRLTSKMLDAQHRKFTLSKVDHARAHVRRRIRHWKREQRRMARLLWRRSTKDAKTACQTVREGVK